MPMVRELPSTSSPRVWIPNLARVVEENTLYVLIDEGTELAHVYCNANRIPAILCTLSDAWAV
ncbi:MAG: hypothetical protein AMXMBFR4_17910 [Candidatus Hydrogenedentota bacterium]